MSVSFEQLCGWLIGAVSSFSILLPVCAQEQSAWATAPHISLATLPPLPSQFFSGRLSVLPQEICETAGVLLPSAIKEQSAMGATECALSEERFFVISRARGTGLVWRVKLNSTPESTTADLARLAQLTEEVHDDIGWRLPSLVVDGIEMGKDIICSSGPILYRFARERITADSFNLVVSTATADMLETIKFKQVPTPCL